MKAKLIVEVTVDPNGVDPEIVKEHLRALAEEVKVDGLFPSGEVGDLVSFGKTLRINGKVDMVRTAQKA